MYSKISRTTDKKLLNRPKSGMYSKASGMCIVDDPDLIVIMAFGSQFTHLVSVTIVTTFLLPWLHYFGYHGYNVSVAMFTLFDYHGYNVFGYHGYNVSAAMFMVFGLPWLQYFC